MAMAATKPHLLLLLLLFFLLHCTHFSASKETGAKAKAKAKAKPKRKPHFLIVVSDDLGYADLGYTGGVMPTPTLDALAAEGTVLTNFYVHPVCTPTRAALMTGKVAAKSGLTGPLLLASPCALPEDLPTLGEDMKKAGYHTILSGKWHLGHHCKGHTPNSRGFDEFYGVLNCCASYMTKIYWHPIYSAFDWRRNYDAVAPPPPKHASAEFAEYMANSVVKHMEGEDKSKPLLMLLTLTAPHSPLQPTEEHLKECEHVKTTRRRLFCGLVVSVDEAVKTVKNALEEQGIWNDTIVFHFNDNGGNVWEGGRNYPFRGGKRSSFEGGSRAVALARIPEQFVGGGLQLEQFNGLMHVSDIKPTLLGFVQNTQQTYEPEFFVKGEGYNLRNALIGLSGSPRQDVLMSYDTTTNVLAYRYKKWKLISGHRGDTKTYEEPMSDNEWVGDSLTDYVAEMIMHFQHWLNEDASGTLDESIRGKRVFQFRLDGCPLNNAIELAMTTKQVWKQIMFTPDETAPMLFDLSEDPYEEVDIADKYPKMVQILLSRVKQMEEEGFGKDCNWFITDTKVTHEQVNFTDPVTKKPVQAYYHGPWVADVDWEAYEAQEVDMLPMRMYTAWVIVGLEILVTLLLVRSILYRTFRLFFGAPKAKTKKE